MGTTWSLTISYAHLTMNVFFFFVVVFFVVVFFFFVVVAISAPPPLYRHHIFFRISCGSMYILFTNLQPRST